MELQKATIQYRIISQLAKLHNGLVLQSSYLGCSAGTVIVLVPCQPLSFSLCLSFSLFLSLATVSPSLSSFALSLSLSLSLSLYHRILSPGLPTAHAHSSK